MLESAYDLVDIEPEVDYHYEEYGGGPIFKLHATRTNDDKVTIILYSGNRITFPPGSFVCGALYGILIREMKFNKTKCSFVGYKMKSKSFSLDI